MHKLASAFRSVKNLRVHTATLITLHINALPMDTMDLNGFQMEHSSAQAPGITGMIISAAM
jgi:hypothetical protein